MLWNGNASDVPVSASLYSNAQSLIGYYRDIEDFSGFDEILNTISADLDSCLGKTNSEFWQYVLK